MTVWMLPWWSNFEKGAPCVPFLSVDLWQKEKLCNWRNATPSLPSFEFSLTLMAVLLFSGNTLKSSIPFRGHRKKKILFLCSDVTRQIWFLCFRLGWRWAVWIPSTGWSLAVLDWREEGHSRTQQHHACQDLDSRRPQSFRPNSSRWNIFGPFSWAVMCFSFVGYKGGILFCFQNLCFLPVSCISSQIKTKGFDTCVVRSFLTVCSTVSFLLKWETALWSFWQPQSSRDPGKPDKLEF